MPGEVWFAIPSASVARCRSHLPAWREMGYRVCVLQDRERGEIPADRVISCDRYPGWAASVNRLCREAVPPDAAAVVTGGDDLLPAPDRPAPVLLREMLDRFPDSFGVMQPCGDPHLNAGEYCGSPWFGRAWIDAAYGGRGPLWPEYRHNWADHELRWVARGLDVLFDRPDVCQRHEHFTKSGEPAPAHWEASVAANDRHDVELFIARLWRGFPGHAPHGDRAAAPPEWWRDRYPGIAERYWATRYGHDRIAGDATRRMRRALHACAERGLRRVVIYGAGTETRAAGDALMDPPVEVVALVDDDPRLRGRRLWGFTVAPIEDAAAHRPDAVILSSRCMNETLAARARTLVEAGAILIDASGEGARGCEGSPARPSPAACGEPVRSSAGEGARTTMFHRPDQPGR